MYVSIGIEVTYWSMAVVMLIGSYRKTRFSNVID